MILNARFSQTFYWFNEAEIDCLESLPNLPTIQKIVQVWFVMSTFYITTSSIYKNRFITRNSGPRACQSKNDEDECVRLYYTYSTTYDYMLLLTVPYQCKCHEPMPRTGATGDCGRFVSVTPERSRRRHEFFGSVGGGLWIHVPSMVLPSCKLPGWKSLKKSYLQQDLQTKLCEELDKRVQVVSGASSSRTASKWIEVARKRSWTPSARISGAAHISIWSYYLECILLHCLPTSEMDNSSIWESLLKTSIVMIWSFFCLVCCMKAQEAAEEQEVMKVNEAVLRGEEALAETEVPLRVVGRMDSWYRNDIYILYIIKTLQEKNTKKR